MHTTVHVQREDVVKFVMCWFTQPRNNATTCVRKMSWGYRVEDPLSKQSGIVSLGDGPTLVHPETGIFISISSNPMDMFGPNGYTSLKTVEDLDKLIENQNRMYLSTIYDFIDECSHFHDEQDKPHVHN